MLRDYQQNAHDAAINWIKKSKDACLIEAATGAGKSHIIAELAASFYELSGKYVLCTAPSAELVEQNHAKFLATGNHASIFSASLGVKSLRHPVVFGTPGTIKNSIDRFGSQFGLIVIDECHGITPTIQYIIDSIKKQNKNLRVVGCTATPFRLGSGLIYAMDEDGKPSSLDQCREPYFTAKVYTVHARELIEQGYLTEPVIGSIHGEHYDTIGMQLNSMGKFNASDIDKAFVGQGRKTANIIADVIEQSRSRNGVMIFAATVKHAVECLESLPPQLSALVTGETPKAERRQILAKFKSRQLKYLATVSVLTTGFDASHVDVIAMLRATESVGLLQQIIGRGLRIDESKKNCLVLDYAENLDRHCPDHDIFNPQIKTFKAKGDAGGITATCEQCNVENEFTARPNEDGFAIDDYGYFVDLDGNRIESEYGAMPAHFGRRCMGLHRQPDGHHERCSYRWTYKKCPACEAENDIAARYCSECKAEIVNPNDKLIADFRARKRDPYQMQCDNVMSWNLKKTLSSAGNEVMKVDYMTEYRSISIWYQIRSGTTYFIKQYEKFLNATGGMQFMPETITYKKNVKTGFFEVYAYNQIEDSHEQIKNNRAA